jgi:hypothetical protein
MIENLKPKNVQVVEADLEVEEIEVVEAEIVVDLVADEAVVA